MDVCFNFSTSGELIRVPSESVVLITADSNYSVLTLVDGSEYVLTMQLGQVEHKLMDVATAQSGRFIRIGKSLIINRNYIYKINLAKQELVLSDSRLDGAFRLSASREALRQLKELLEKEAGL